MEGGTDRGWPQAQTTIMPSFLIIRAVILRKQSCLILQFQASLLNVKILAEDDLTAANNFNFPSRRKFSFFTDYKESVWRVFYFKVRLGKTSFRSVLLTSVLAIGHPII